MAKKNKATKGSQISNGVLNFQSISSCKGSIIVSFLLGILASIIANSLG